MIPPKQIKFTGKAGTQTDLNSYRSKRQKIDPYLTSCNPYPG